MGVNIVTVQHISVLYVSGQIYGSMSWVVIGWVWDKVVEISSEIGTVIIDNLHGAFGVFIISISIYV